MTIAPIISMQYDKNIIGVFKTRDLLEIFEMC